jgi:hypothetical protein
VSSATRAANESSSSPVSLHGLVLALLYLAGFAAVGTIAWNGAGFYRTPLLERAHHEGFWHWKAGGSIGHTLGKSLSAAQGASRNHDDCHGVPPSQRC